MIPRSFLGHSPLGFHNIAYMEWGQVSAEPPVICVHGLIRNSRDFDTLAMNLLNETQVLCPDIAGRGQSQWLADPSLYGYPQYINDMTALIARTGHPLVDWVGTSMGGIIGMFLAAAAQTPIRRLVVNDVGPYIPLAGLQRIAAYVAAPPDFGTFVQGEAHLRKTYASFGITNDDDWRHMATNSLYQGKDGRWRMAYDPGIAQSLATLKQDVDFWALYDLIKCPVLVLRGAQSDILPDSVAQEMTKRGPKAQLIEIPDVGHAPALIADEQISLVKAFLRSSD